MRPALSDSWWRSDQAHDARIPDSRPCKVRKSGAPAVLLMPARSTAWATRHELKAVVMKITSFWRFCSATTKCAFRSRNGHGRLASIGNDKAYALGIRDALDYITVFATTAQGPEKGVLGKFLAAAQKRFAKFA
jgi:hypothetical protein